MKVKISCKDKYEAQKLSSLIFIKEGKETYIIEILNVIDTEVVVLLKDKSAHSILFKNEDDVEKFADFLQSILEKKHKVTETILSNNEIEITKEWN